jgi:predicted phosphodiesterase
LDEDDFNFLRTFKSIINKSLVSGIELHCYHGSPESNTGVLLSTSENSILDAIIDQHQVQIYVGGHTHLQMLRRHNGKMFINPGSVGSAFPRFFLPGETPTLLPQAEYVILIIENEHLNITMRQVPFDIETLKKFISQSDIPIKDWWLAQYC